MPLRRIHGAKANVRLPRSHHGHLCICRTMTSRLVFRCLKKSVSSVCSQWQLAARQRLLQNVYQPDASFGSQRNTKTWRHVGTVGKMALTSSWQYGPHDFHSLGPLRSTWLVSNLQQTPTRTKLSRPRCCTDTSYFYVWIPACLPRWECLMSAVASWRSDACHLRRVYYA